MSGWQLVPVPELSGFTVEWASPHDYILSRRNSLYHAPELSPPFAALARLPLAGYLQTASRLDLVRRALRLSYYNVVRIGGERIFATFNRSVVVITRGETKRVRGLDRLFRVLRNGCAVAKDGSVWFGEYVITPEPTPLRVYRLPPEADRAEVVHVFPAGFARHIHGLYADPVDGSIWCLTGDHGSHAKVMRSPDGLEAFTTIGAGDESWRAVSMEFRTDAIYYATDAMHCQNWIYRVDRNSGERTPVAPVDGPVYYSHRVGADLFFAVTAELSPIQQDRSATLWHLDPDDRCARVATFTKDRWPVAQFLPGTLSFPRGDGDNRGFYVSGVALSAIKGKTFRCAPITSSGTDHEPPVEPRAS